MELQLVSADRGQLLALEPIDGFADAHCVGVSRLGGVQMAGGAFTFWVQLRGSGWVESKEGRFELSAGDWIAFERESRPMLQVDRHGLCIGLSLTAEAQRALARLADSPLYAGRGRIARREARIALRLWRETLRRVTRVGGGDADLHALRPLLLHFASLQRELAARLPRCPGRSRHRKRQVFGRLQRARLYLEGNRDRVVRITELAELTSFSSWYFSKTFHSLYDESPQAASARMRLERAAELLRDSSMLVGEVAAACGFDNACSFARAFRARHGVSATDYRARALATDSAKRPTAAGKAVQRSAP